MIVSLLVIFSVLILISGLTYRYKIKQGNEREYLNDVSIDDALKAINKRYSILIKESRQQRRKKNGKAGKKKYVKVPSIQ